MTALSNFTVNYKKNLPSKILKVSGNVSVLASRQINFKTVIAHFNVAPIMVGSYENFVIFETLKLFQQCSVALSA